MLFLPMVTHAQNEVPINKEGLKQRTGFIENKGQIIEQNNKPNPSVLYLLNTPGMNVQLRKAGFSYDVYSIEYKPNPHHVPSNNQNLRNPNPKNDSLVPEYHFHRIDIDLQNANPDPVIETSAPLKDYLNYYTTGTPEEGVTLVKSFCGIIYKNIYPDIDLQFISNDGVFEYNFLVQPGADIASIQLKVTGPQRIKSFKEKIQMITSVGDIDETIPLCYYSLNNIQVPVKGRFKKIKDQLYGFSVDKTIPNGAYLLIDPVPTRRWGTYYGGINTTGTQKKACSTDGLGNIIIAGGTMSTNNIATTGAYQVIISGTTDAFLGKFNTDGQRLWGTYYGGSASESGYGCSVDRNDNIFLVGYTTSNNSIASTGAYQTVLHGQQDGMLIKFTSGGQRIWGTYYGGNEYSPWGQEGIEVCTVDTNGNVYCTGLTDSPDFIASPGAHQTSPGGNYDTFLAKFTANGQRVWGTYYGGSNADQNPCCAVINQGYVFLSGNTLSANNIATPGSFLPNLNGFQKTFLAAFNLNGQRLWGTYYAGEFDDWNYGCTADTGNNVYIYGVTSSITNIATPGSFQETGVGGYLAKFNYNGIRLWGTYYGTGGTNVTEAAVDDSANIIIAGSTHDQNNIIPSPGAFQSVYRGGFYDSFLGKFNSGGQRFWGTYYGGTGQEGAMGCAVDHYDNIYLLSNTVSENNSDNNANHCTRSGSFNYIATPGAFLTEKPSLLAVFLVKFTDCYSPDTALQINGPIEICTNSSGSIYSIDPIHSATDYHWCVSGNLSITSGQGSTSVNVSAGSVVGTDTISVYGINSCDNGFPKSIVVNVIRGAVPTLTGITSLCQGENITYTTESGKTGYVWNISPGGINTGGGNSTQDFISVTWNTPGVQWVSVNYSEPNGCTAGTATLLNVDVAAGLPVDVAITASQSQVCSGSSVTFTATPTNQGTSPIYQWKVNGINAGTNNPIYTYNPINGDIVTCVLTSSILVCIANNPATSNSITMVVDPNLPVINSISPSVNPVCVGTVVTFTAVPIHGGITPIYQWKVNAINVIGATNSTYTYTPLNGDVVTCDLTSSDNCVTGNPALSPPVTMTVTPNPAVTLSITPSANPFCLGSQVTFIAIPNHGGLFPIYLWKVNGSNAGTNSSSFTYTPLNGDVVTCELTSSDNCVTGNPATSTPVTMTASPVLAVSVAITASSNPFCAGSQVIFSATPNNGGLVPAYQWKVNGSNTGTNSPSFTYSPANGDQVSCILNSSASCITGNPAFSNIITMTVNTNLPAGVSISTPTNPFCPGTAVTFTANPTNGGGTPSYQWKLNGVNAGNNSTTFTCNPVVGDSIRCMITSNLNCVTGNPASSAKIIMSGNPVPLVSFTMCFDTVTLLSGKPFNLHGGLPLGGQYSGPGVNSITGTFTPSVAGTGLKTITYGYSNVFSCLASKTKTILVQPNQAFTCGSNLTDNRDNKVYPTVQIGSQCWMAANLNYGTVLNSSQVQNDNCISEKYCYNDVPGNCIKYGGLYQWDEVMKYDDTPAGQGLCPPGWHVPTEAEWTTLFNFYLGNGLAGKPLQDTIIAGFRAQTSGVYYLNSTWSFNGFATLFWTSTPWNAVKAISHGMNVYDFSVSLYPSSRANAFPVRCLKD